MPLINKRQLVHKLNAAARRLGLATIAIENDDEASAIEHLRAVLLTLAGVIAALVRPFHPAVAAMGRATEVRRRDLRHRHAATFATASATTATSAPKSAARAATRMAGTMKAIDGRRGSMTGARPRGKADPHGPDRIVAAQTNVTARDRAAVGSGCVNQRHAHLPEGVTEIYTHPATASDFAGAAPGYRYEEELAALTSPDLPRLIAATGVASGGFSEAIGFSRQ
jgi:hypothetical protein